MGIRVVFFQRKPFPFHKSVEFIFDDVRRRLPVHIRSIKFVFNHYSKGIWPRIKIILEANKNQGDINHITGDIHFAAIGLKKSRTLLTVLDCGMLSGSWGIKHVLLKYFWFTLPLKYCGLVTVISAATKNELLKYVNYPKKKIHIIPVAVSPAYRYVPKTFNRDRPVILQIGTKFNKNIGRLIEAIKDIPCRLQIVGRLEEHIKEKLEVCQIDYLNFYDLSEQELVEKYVQCDLLSFVSTYEGFGMPIVEANAVGRPVITSNLLSMPEVAGNAACLVDPYDVEAIKAGIVRIISDPVYREQLVENGLQNCKRFDPDVIAGMYVDLYEKIAGS